MCHWNYKNQITSVCMKIRRVMKFVLSSVRNGGCRAGVIESIGHHGNKAVETPMCMLYTRGGSAPHLTVDMLKKIQGLPAVAQVSLSMMAYHQEALEEYGGGIRKFAAMEDFLIYSTLHDTCTEVPSGYNEKTGVAVWGKGGKIKLDVEQFMKVQEAVQPDWYQALSDGDTSKESSRKRAIKAVDRTLAFLDQILEKHSQSEKLRDVNLFGSVVGGYSEEQRVRSAKETAARSVEGFVIDGFHSFGPDTEDFPWPEVGDLIQKILTHLPEDKPRLMQSVWKPHAVLDAVEIGIDIFDSSYLCLKLKSL